jgi:hypothetical protein
MGTRASDLAACARRLGISNPGEDPTAVIEVPELEGTLGHLPTASMPMRVVRPGIGGLVCTINTTAEPEVLHGLLNAIMGLDVEESRALHSRVRALPVDGIPL